MTDPLADLWAADEPPARDRAFTAAAIARAGEMTAAADRRRTNVLRVLRGLGMGAGVVGAALVFGAPGLNPWALAIVASALGGALWVGRGLFAGA